MTNQQSLSALIEALKAVADVVPPKGIEPLSNAVFVGSGDSLSSAMLANRFGHRSMSSGDITWMDELPARCETLVGISHSGTSGATVRALRLANAAGIRTIAITSNPDSPLAEAADFVQQVPSLHVSETVPCSGHLMLGLGVATLTGATTAGAGRTLAQLLEANREIIEDAIEALPVEAPSGISVLTLPDVRSGGDFWMLKLIEACGLPVRSVALEESGHVDYFIGPQPYLALSLVGAAGAGRHTRLAEALASTGQQVQTVSVAGFAQTDNGTPDMIMDLGAAVVGTFLAAGAAKRWGRPPFRGGAVNMDARHIKLDEQPAI
ncbi:SIS domain-containing protein [Glaciibacter sp. 2TAF33]|uniref:SIS domain-containing protein n=1 Tax=Glaciibacter sp. 2TAF33 TaxID=3233015 RepID=UPI003F917813